MKCAKCFFHKNETEFYEKDKTCKECRKKIAKEHRAKNAEYYREYDRKRANNPERVSARAEYAKTKKGLEAGKKAKAKWIAKNTIKRAAHHIVNNSIRDGKIQKVSICQICGSKPKIIHAHHDDYAHPLKVRWLCSKCHTAWHKENGEGLNSC